MQHISDEAFNEFLRPRHEQRLIALRRELMHAAEQRDYHDKQAELLHNRAVELVAEIKKLQAEMGS